MQTDTPFPYTEMFEKCLPYYMAMGMSYDDYWHGDALMPRAVRESFKIKRRFNNEDMWMQGAYIYKVMEAFAPILPAFPKSGARVGAYTDILPIDKEQEKQVREAREKKDADEMLAKFTAWTARVNPHLGGEEHERNSRQN